MFSYGTRAHSLKDNSSQFSSTFFETLCNHLGKNHLTTTSYHPQCNGLVERYNETIASRLCQYLASHQRDLGLFVQHLTYVYNAQVHRSTNTTPFSLLLLRQTPGPATFDTLSALPAAAYHETHPQTIRTQILHRIKVLRSRVGNRLRTAHT